MAHIYTIDDAWCLESILHLVGVGLVCKLRTPHSRASQRTHELPGSCTREADGACKMELIHVMKKWQLT